MNLNFLELFHDSRGTLGSIEFSRLPFEPKRFYFVRMIENEVRGKHSHIELQQLIFVVQGTVEFEMKSRNSVERRLLSQGEYLLIGPNVWREFRSIGGAAVIGCLASEPYLKSDYVFDFEKFLEL
jgi:mannose-6-phosphate isomerase-like protein (cupin superfamily)